MVGAYGTLEAGRPAEAAVEKRASYAKYVAVFAAVSLLVVGVVAFSSTASTSVNSVVDSNRNRASIAKVDSSVRDLGMDVLNMTVSGLRWAIFGFNGAKDEIIPLTAAPATADWEKDFKMFTNALPETDAAVAVYNFEYWVDDMTTEVEPIMITWAPHCDTSDPNRPTGPCNGLSEREEARAGYYLPAIILALNTNEGRINTGTMATKGDKIGEQKDGMANVVQADMFSGPYRLDRISDSYYNFCQNEMGLPEKDCALEKGFHNCPFESEDESEWSDANPCKQPACAGDSFERSEGALPGTISQGCCDYIQDAFCADPANYATQGCHAVTLSALDKLCEIPKEGPAVIMEETWQDMTVCDEQCASPCPIIAEAGEASDTWKKCEGCRMDMQPDENGVVAQCYPGAYGYETDICCGNELDENGEFFCEQDDNLSAEVCNMLEYYDCKWIPQRDCPEEKRSQDIEDAPVGCCYSAGEGDELFGTDGDFSLGEVPEVLCGGGKYADDGDETTFAGADVTCDDLLAGFQEELDTYLASLVVDEATTAAPAEARV